MQDGLFGLVPPEPSFRYVYLGGYDLTHVAQSVRQAGSVRAAMSAQYSSLGNVTDEILEGATPHLAAGETLQVRYSSAAESGSEFEWFVLVHRTGEDAPTSWTRPAREALAPRPIQFALHQNHPNPFSRGTTIRFDLPTAARVDLEVFDLQGRRVRTLAKARLEPGSMRLTEINETIEATHSGQASTCTA